MSDFFGEYVAPGAFLIGAGMTGARALNEMRASKGGLASVWKQQAEQDAFFNSVKEARGKVQYRMSMPQLLDEMDLDTSRYGKAGAFASPEKREAFNFARQRTLETFVDTFNLRSTIDEMGIDLETASREDIESLLKRSPLDKKGFSMHMEGLQRVARNYGLLNLVDVGSADSATNEALQSSAKRAEASIISAYETYGAEVPETISDFMRNNPTIAGDLHPSKYQNPPIDINSNDDITRLFSNFDRTDKDDLVGKTHKLFNKMNKLKRMPGRNLKMKLLTMQEAGQEFISGVRIEINGGTSRSRVADVFILDKYNNARTGFFGQRKMIARNVVSENAKRHINSGEGKWARRADIALLDHLSGHIDDYATGAKDWDDTIRSLTGSSVDDAGKVLMPVTLNKELNARRAAEVVTKDIGVGYHLNEYELAALDARKAAENIDISAGLGPNQRVAGQRVLRRPGDRVAGVLSFGQGTGDDKTTQQRVKEKVITSNRARTQVKGRLGLAAGAADQITTYSLPEEGLRALISQSSRPDIGLREDTAILLDRNIGYRDLKNTTLQSNSAMSPRLKALLMDVEYKPFRRARRAPGGIEGRLARLRAQRASLPRGTVISASGNEINKRQLLDDYINRLEESRTLRASDVIGEATEGGFVKGSKEGRFLITDLEHTWTTGAATDQKTGKFIIKGMVERNLQEGDKLFGSFKRVLSDTMDPAEAKYMAALWEASKSDPELKTLLANAEGLAGSGDEAAIQASRNKLVGYFKPGMDAFKSARVDLARHQLEQIEKGRGFRTGVNISKIVPPNMDASEWRNIVSKISGAQVIDVQGITKIGERRMDVLAESLLGRVADERVRIEQQMSQFDNETRAYLQANDPNRMKTWNEFQSKTKGRYPSRTDAAADFRVFGETAAGAGGSSGVDGTRIDKWLQNRMDSAGRISANLTSIDTTLANLGVVGRDGNTFIVDDAVGLGNNNKNLVRRTNLALAETMLEGNRGPVKTWSAQQLFKDLSVSEALTAETRASFAEAASWSEGERRKVALSLLHDDARRPMVFKALESQVRYGLQNVTASVGGNPRMTTGSGRRGSFNINMIRHLNAQGGIMKKLGTEIAGRMVGETGEEAAHVFRRAAAYHGKIQGRNVVPLSKLSQNKELRGALSGLTGRNQFQRDLAFNAIKEHYGVAADADFIMLDIGDGRMIYHPQAISKNTGAFVTPAGTPTISGVDKAMNQMIRGAVEGGKKGKVQFEKGVARYGDEVAKITIGKGQAPSKIWSGKVQGSKRLQARPQIADELFRLAGYSGDDLANIRDSIGIRESQYRSMLADAGIVDNYDERLRDLRIGNEAGMISRQPATELHRATSAKMFSIDEVVRKATGKKLSMMSDLEVLAELSSLDRRRHKAVAQRLINDSAYSPLSLEEAKAKAVKRYESRLEGLQEKVQNLKKKKKQKAKSRRKKFVSRRESYLKRKTAEFLEDSKVQSEVARGELYRTEYRKAYADKFADFTTYLPKQLEMALGADFDDDQLDLFIAKKEEIRKSLISRTSYQDRLRRGAVKVGDATTVLEQGAEEAFIYKQKQRELYEGLKKTAYSALTEADIQVGTDAWKMRKRAETLMAHMEKGYIGAMTNSVDFSREFLRSNGSKSKAEARLFSEMLLGILPETALKARQVGPSALMDKELGVGDAITDLKKIIGGEYKLKSRDKQVEMFNRAFRTVHGQTELTDELLKYSGDVIDSVKAGKLDHNILERMMKATPTEEKLVQALDSLADSSIPSRYSATYTDAVKDFVGGNTMLDEGKRHIKNTAATLDSALGLMGKYKKPALIGGAIALATNALLASPSSISEEEAIAAGARHQNSAPSIHAAEYGHGAPVTPGPGQRIRIRGRSNGDPDIGGISNMLQGLFPGSNVSYNMNDYREQINEEYLRKRLNRQ